MGILEPDTYFGGSLVLDKERANAAVNSLGRAPPYQRLWKG
jgi:hypothetical protein